MSQATIEAGIIAVITKHADFDTDNTKLNDWRHIAKGLARLVHVGYNTHREEELTIKLTRRVWSYNIDVLVPWKGEIDELMGRVATETQKILDTMAQYPKLDGVSGVLKAILTVSNTPDVISYRRGVYRGRRHALDVYELVDPNRQE